LLHAFPEQEHVNYRYFGFWDFIVRFVWLLGISISFTFTSFDDFSS